MKKVLIPALFGLALASVGNAADTGDFYGTVEGGYTFGDIRWGIRNDGGSTMFKPFEKITSAQGFKASVGAGYHFDPSTRLQFNFGYSDLGKKEFKVNTSTTANATLIAFNADATYRGTPVNDRTVALTAEQLAAEKFSTLRLRTISALASLYYDFNNDSAVVPYIGAGLGVNGTALYRGFALTAAAVSPSEAARKWSLGYQVSLGADYKVNDCFLVGIKYGLANAGRWHSDVVASNTIIGGAASNDAVREVYKNDFSHTVGLTARFYM